MPGQASRWLVRVGLLGALALTFASCGARHPSDICEEYRQSANELRIACGLDPYPEIWLTWVDGPCEGLMTSCEYVQRIKEPREMLDGCLPAIQRATCEEYLAFSGDLQLCLDQFEGPQGDRTTCRPD